MQELFNELLVRELERLLAPGVSLERAEAELARIQYGLTPDDRENSDDPNVYIGELQPTMFGFFREYFTLSNDALLQIAPEVHEWLLQRFAGRPWIPRYPVKFGTLGALNTLNSLGRIYRLYPNSAVSYTVMGLLLEIDDPVKLGNTLAAAHVWQPSNRDAESANSTDLLSPREISEDILAYIDILPLPVEEALRVLRSSANRDASVELDRNLRRWSERLGGDEGALIARVLRD